MFWLKYYVYVAHTVELIVKKKQPQILSNMRYARA